MVNLYLYFRGDCLKSSNCRWRNNPGFSSLKEDTKLYTENYFFFIFVNKFYLQTVRFIRDPFTMLTQVLVIILFAFSDEILTSDPNESPLIVLKMSSAYYLWLGKFQGEIFDGLVSVTGRRVRWTKSITQSLSETRKGKAVTIDPFERAELNI